MARVDEIVSGIYRISTTMGSGEAAFQFNQFLIDDERPALVHTGLHQMYEDVCAAVAQVLDPTRLAYIVPCTSRLTSAAAWTASWRAPRTRCSRAVP